MRHIKIIFLKDFRGYFNSAIGYIILTAWLGVTGWFFVHSLFISKQAVISGFFTLAPFLFMLLVPVVSMKLLAEEEKTGTAEILATMPIKDWEIITGKYLAIICFWGIGILATLVYPLSVMFVGKIDWGVVLSSYLGLILLMCGFSSIGIFGSSITKSQIASAIITVVICFIIFIIGKILGVMPSFIVPLMQYVGIDYHLESMGRGVIDLKNIIYFFSMIGFFLSFAFYFYRKTKGRILSGMAMGTILGIIIVVNFLTYNIPIRFDLTQGKVYSLSRASLKVIKKLEDPIIVKAYITGNLPFPYNVRSKYTKDLLTEYRMRARKKFKFKCIDPKTRELKMEARRAGVMPLQFTEIKEGEYGVKEGYMGLTIMYGDEKEVIPVVENIGTLEYDITSKIKKLLSKKTKHIVFTEGHEEIKIPDEVETKIKEQYNVSKINPEKDSIPEETEVLVIVGPKKEFSDTGRKRVEEFIEKGGKCAFFLDPVNVDMERFFGTKLKTGLEELLSKKYEIKIKEGLVLDLQNQLVGISAYGGWVSLQLPYPFFPKITSFNKDNPIVRELESVVLPYSAPIEGGIPLLKSSKRSWLTKRYFSLNPMQRYFPQPEDEKGPFTLGVYIEKPSRCVIVGNARFISPQFATPFNLALFMNTIDWLAEDEELIAIRSKGVQDRPLKPVGVGIRRGIRWINVLLPSLCLVGLGIVRWRKRERKEYNI